MLKNAIADEGIICVGNEVRQKIEIQTDMRTLIDHVDN